VIIFYSRENLYRCNNLWSYDNALTKGHDVETCCFRDDICKSLIIIISGGNCLNSGSISSYVTLSTIEATAKDLLVNNESLNLLHLIMHDCGNLVNG